MNCCQQYINLSHRDDVDDTYLSKLSLPTLKRFNLAHTKVTYDGIVTLWRSNNIGKTRYDDALYESYYNLPISLVYVEIKNTPVLEQYHTMIRKNGHKIFPLPLRKDFMIKYDRENEEVSGFKKVVLTVDGIEIT